MQTPTISQPNHTLVPRRKRFTRGLLITLGVLVALHFACAGLTATILTSPIRRVFAATTPATLGLSYQDLRLKSRGEDIQLAAWYIPATNSTRAIVFVHGKDASKSGEFRGRSVQLAKALHDRGYSVLMLDLRGHGESADARITYGLRERHDVEAAVDWLRAHGYAPESIGVLGVSIGSAAALYAAAEEPAIAAVVSDSGYADIRSVFINASNALAGLPATVIPLGSLLARWITGEDIVSVAPIDQVQRILPRPIMVIHGANDQLVPPTNATRLAQAAGTQAWFVPGANHAQTYIAAPEEYARRVADFFDTTLH